MKRFVCAAALALAASSAFAADVGVSISVGEPGFYGVINIGDFPRPQVVYAQPVVVQPVPVGVVVQPMYLHVPPGHMKKWHKYCGSYGACGRPVYFVRDEWYNGVYVPTYRKRHGHDDDDDHGKRHGKGHGRGHDD